MADSNNNNNKPLLVPVPPLAPAREPKRDHYCACSWGSKCTEIRKILLQRSENNGTSPDPRAGRLRSLSLVFSNRKTTTSSSPSSAGDNGNNDNEDVRFCIRKPQVWRSCVETSLGTSFASWPAHQLLHVPIARHHWTRRQNEFFDQKGGAVSKPLPREEIIPLLENGQDDLNETMFSLQKLVHKKQVTVYFIPPSVSMESLMDEIAPPKIQNLTTAEKFNALTYQDYCATEETLIVQAQELAFQAEELVEARAREEDLSIKNKALRDTVAALREQLLQEQQKSKSSSSSSTSCSSANKRQKKAGG